MQMPGIMLEGIPYLISGSVGWIGAMVCRCFTMVTGNAAEGEWHPTRFGNALVPASTREDNKSTNTPTLKNLSQNQCKRKFDRVRRHAILEERAVNAMHQWQCVPLCRLPVIQVQADRENQRDPAEAPGNRESWIAETNPGQPHSRYLSDRISIQCQSKCINAWHPGNQLH